MKIIFIDTDNNINVEIEIPNKNLQSMEGVDKAALQIAGAFVKAIEKQGVLVPQSKAKNDSNKS